MSPLEKIKKFIQEYPGFNILGTFSVDYTDSVPGNGGIFPSGLVEISRVRDICGETTVQNQYNFALYYVFEKSPEVDSTASFNADWLMDFQKWVQEMSCSGNAPTFGDEPETERITAQNGVLYEAEAEGIATYTVQLSVSFTKIYVKEK